MHLVLRILSNPRIYIVVLLYKSLSNPNISIGLYRLFFSFSRFVILQKFLDPQKHALIDSMWKPF
jgi:hypothetical protein